MDRLKKLAFTFACISTCVLIGSAVYITIFEKDAALTVDTLWQFIGVNALCTLGNLIYPREVKNKKRLYILTALHYLYINAVVMLSGLFFEWYRPEDLSMILGLLVVIAAVFAAVTAILHFHSKIETERLNQRLKEYIERKE